MSNPTQKSPERAYALQNYMMLHSQHDALQKQVSNIYSRRKSSTSSPNSAASVFSSSSSSTSSGSVSPNSEDDMQIKSIPTDGHHNRRDSHHYYSRRGHPHSSSSSSSPDRSYGSSAEYRRSSRRLSLPTLEERPYEQQEEQGQQFDEELTEEEIKLMEVNMQIKTTLTELLNCESVRSDRQYRTWILTRLMDAERELKDGKREVLDMGRRRSGDFVGIV